MLMILQFWHLPVACCFSSNWVWPGNFHLKIFTEDSFYASSTWQDLGPDTAVICCEQIIIATYRTFWSIWTEKIPACDAVYVQWVTSASGRWMSHWHRAGCTVRWSLQEKPAIHFLNCTWHVESEVAVARQTEIVSHLFVLALGKKEEIERKNLCMQLLLESRGTVLLKWLYKIH